MSSDSLPPEPWHSFLSDLDEASHSTARLDCIAGFVVTQFYGLARPTADVDVIERNSQKDRDDVRYLSRVIPFDLATSETL
jgi:hypothetical protein